MDMFKPIPYNEMRKTWGLENIFNVSPTNRNYQYLLRQNEVREEHAKIAFQNGSEMRSPVGLRYSSIRVSEPFIAETNELDAEAYRMMIGRVSNNIRVHVMGDFTHE